MKARAVFRLAFAIAVPVAMVGAGTPGIASAAGPTLPQSAAADAGALWLSSQFTSAGYIPVSPGSLQPNFGDTAEAVLAFETTRSEAPLEAQAITYLSKHVNAYVRVGGHDAPGQLSTLILADVGAGKNPRSFAGTNLVSRLEATMRTSGTQAGLFGVQPPTYDGAYRQGLALVALAAAGVSGSTVAPAVAWLESQECSSGGWKAFRSDPARNCPPVDPATYSGPDTNSTALAVEGLAAQGVATSDRTITWLANEQTAEGGWPYQKGDAFDANSTAVVIQALIAAGVSPTAARFDKGSQDVVAALLSLQVSSGPGQGGIAFQPNGDGSLTADLLATLQAVPALEGLALLQEAPRR